MGLFGPSKKKIELTIEKDIRSALTDLSNTVGLSKFNKCKQVNSGVIYGFAYGVAAHTWEVMHNHTKPDWKGYAEIFDIVDNILNIDKGSHIDFHMVGWNYQQGKYHNKDFGSLNEIATKVAQNQ